MKHRLKSFFTAKADQIYIIPTGHGLMFAFGILVMVLTAATYNNNLIYLLGFLLFAVLVVSMLMTHQNLKGARLIQVWAEDCEAGQDIPIRFRIANRGQNEVYALRVRARGQKIDLGRGPQVLQLKEADSQNASLIIPAKPRGVYTCPNLILESVYPLGLFRAWKSNPQTHLKIYVYPQARGSQKLESNLLPFEGQHGQNPRKDQSSDFREHQLIQPGESVRHVDWKVFAKKSQLLRKTFEEDLGEQYLIDLSRIHQGNLEQKLSQVSLWITKLDQRGASYSLKVGEDLIPFAQGPRHRSRCLRALAEVEDV